MPRRTKISVRKTGRGLNLCFSPAACKITSRNPNGTQSLLLILGCREDFCSNPAVALIICLASSRKIGVFWQPAVKSCAFFIVFLGGVQNHVTKLLWHSKFAPTSAVALVLFRTSSTIISVFRRKLVFSGSRAVAP